MRSETIDDSTETVALLADVPAAGDTWVSVYIRLAGTYDGHWSARAFFTGVEVFVV